MTTDARARFRRILEGPDCLRPASVYDPLSARIAEAVGYPVAMLAGSTASLAVLGAPDLVVLSATELADQVRRICRAVDLPLVVDGDHGYGNALNVMRTVEEMESAGAAALTIEDTQLPAPYGSQGKAHLIGLDEAGGKVGAALTARRDPGFAIVGRTSALLIAGLEAAVERVRLFDSAGVDAIFLVGVATRDELDLLAGATRRPLVLGNVGVEIDDAAYLASRGVRLSLQGHLPVRAAVQAIHDAMSTLYTGDAAAALPDLASPELMRKLTRQDRYDEWARRFLGHAATGS